MYHSRDTLLIKHRRALARTTEEPLETFQTPFIHLGGAGFHYNTGRIRNGYIVKPGPVQRKAILESTETPGAVVDIDFDMSEYEGDWFDSNDVEGYLNNKGIFINPQSSFAEAEITVSRASSVPPNVFDSPPPTSAEIELASFTTSVATPRTSISDSQGQNYTEPKIFSEFGPTSPGTLWNNSAADWLLGSGAKTPDFMESGWNGMGGMNAPNGQDKVLSGWDMLNNMAMDDFGSLQNTNLPPLPEQKRQVTVDVNRFIDGEFSIQLRAVYMMLTCYRRTHQKRHLSRPSPWLQEEGRRSSPGSQHNGNGSIMEMA
jgi:hypothetical protein